MSTSMKQTCGVNQDVHLAFDSAYADAMQKRCNITCRFYQAGCCRRGTSCPFSHKPIHSHRKLRNCTSQNRVDFPLSQAPQLPLYYPQSASTLPFSLWHPAYSSSPPLVCAPRCTITADPILRDDPHDTSSSEGSPLCVKSINHDVHAAFGNLEDSNPPASPPPVVLYRQFSAVPRYPEPSSTEWMTYFTSCNAKVDPFGRFVMPPFEAHSLVQSAVSCQDKQMPRTRKPFAYQTKPCRYFVATGKCQSGNKCTFIHDSRSRKATEKFSNNSTSVDARELESRKNLCQSKDFYPITWRVIGGGVMMGGERKVCDAFITGYCKDGDDCKFAHETELELDPIGCLKVRSEAELPAARVFLCEANSRESNGTGEKPALNSPQGHSQLKRPCDAPTSAAKLPVPAETSQQKTPGGMPPEQMDLGTQEIGEVEITEVSTVKPLSTVPHRRTRSMVGPLSSLHAEPIVASPSFLAEF